MLLTIVAKVFILDICYGPRYASEMLYLIQRQIQSFPNRNLGIEVIKSSIANCKQCCQDHGIIKTQDLGIKDFKNRSSPKVICKEGALKNFTGKQLCRSLFFNNVASVSVSCEFYEIFKNIFFYRTPPVAASVKTFWLDFFVGNL